MKDILTMRKILMLVMLGLMALHVNRAIGQCEMVKQGSATQLRVNGKKMLIIGGELSNSAATCIADIDEVMPRMKALGLNTVLVPAEWDLIEPIEGTFDFTLIDRTIIKARENGLKVVFLWFGAWKNSMSCYAPMWFKQDVRRFPRSETASGKPLEIASAFSKNVFDADCKALVKLVGHIKKVDVDNTVIMMQVENEIGMLESARDHSTLANKEYEKAVPEQLRTYILKNNKTIHPNLLEILTGNKQWTQQSSRIIYSKLKKSCTWAEAFGNDLYGDEIFMAYFYALYVQKLCEEIRKVKDIPLYVNAAMNSRGRKPGEYPSAGPLAHLIDIWKAAAPDIDMLSPDIYDAGFKTWADKYKNEKNALFIPETKCCENTGARALYVYGEHDAIGCCPFAIDQASMSICQSISKANSLVNNMMPILLKYQGQGCMHGLLFDTNDKERIIADDDIRLTCQHYFTLPWDSRATDGSVWPEGGAIVIRLAVDEYLIAGTGVVITFQTSTEKEQEQIKKLGEDGFVADTTSDVAQSNIPNKRFKGKRIGIGYVDQVKVDENGNLQYLRRDNGDQSHQGRHARISVGEYKILHVKLYRY